MKITKEQIKQIIKEELTNILSEMEMTPEERAWAEEQYAYRMGTDTISPDERPSSQQDLIDKFVGDVEPTVWDIMYSDENLEQEENRQFIEQSIKDVTKTNLDISAKLKLRSVWSTINYGLEGDLWKKLQVALEAQGVDKI